MPAKIDEETMVYFPIGTEGCDSFELMHAQFLGGDRYVIDNSPFYAFGVSFGDTCIAEERDGALVFVKIVARGRHSTYRIKLPPNRDHNYFLQNWKELESLGCSFEGSSANLQRLYAIDVRPGVDVFEVYSLLEDGERNGIWTFEEGHYFDPTDLESDQASEC